MTFEETFAYWLEKFASACCKRPAKSGGINILIGYPQDVAGVCKKAFVICDSFS